MPVSSLPEGTLFVILAGQSNMAGFVPPATPDDVAGHPDVWAWAGGHGWVPAREPLHGRGVGPGVAFGRALADAGHVVGLVPCAVNGTSVRQWRRTHGRRGRALRVRAHADTCVRRVRAATDGAPVAAILWQQGEAEAVAGTAGYGARLAPLLDDLQRRTDAACVLGGELVGLTLHAPSAKAVRADQRRHFGAHFVTAADLPLDADGLHLTPAAARELGARYARAFLTRCAG